MHAETESPKASEAPEEFAKVQAELGAALERQSELTPEDLVQLLRNDELASVRRLVWRRLHSKREERIVDHYQNRVLDMSDLSSEAKAEATAQDSEEKTSDQTTENAE